MSPAMFVYITTETMRTFHFSFPLLRPGPLLQNFNFNFVYIIHLKECCDYSFMERRENSLATFSYFYNGNLDLSTNQTI